MTDTRVRTNPDVRYLRIERNPVDRAVIKQQDVTETVESLQAEVDGLWFVARTAPEAYLQEELRYLHHVIEGTT